MSESSRLPVAHGTDALAEGLEFDDQDVEAVVRSGPAGTWAVAGVATLVVVAIYFAFYLFAYLPRGAVQ